MIAPDDLPPAGQAFVIGGVGARGARDLIRGTLIARREARPSGVTYVLDIHMQGAHETRHKRHVPALLARAHAIIEPGGTLLLREADTERGWRSWATWLEERVFTLLRVNRGARVRFRAASELTARLEGEGLRCRVVPAWGKTPFSNVLVVASRT